MKKAILCLCIFSLFAIALNAQENAPETSKTSTNETGDMWDKHPWTLGIGADYGFNTRVKSTLGYGITFERYLFCPWLGLGIRGMMYDDFKSITATEAMVTLRLWLPEPIGLERTFFFTQWGFGASFYREDERNISTYVMDAALGCRILLGKTYRFYVEPYVRTGFPFLFSAGVTAGRRFDF
jgi:hypothetical protein